MADFSNDIESVVTTEYDARTPGGQASTAAVGAAVATGLIASGALTNPTVISALESIASSIPYSNSLVNLGNPLFQGLPIVAGFCAVNDSPEAAAVAGGAAVAWSLYKAIEAYTVHAFTLSQSMYAFGATLFPMGVGMSS